MSAQTAARARSARAAAAAADAPGDRYSCTTPADEVRASSGEEAGGAEVAGAARGGWAGGEGRGRGASFFNRARTGGGGGATLPPSPTHAHARSPPRDEERSPAATTTVRRARLGEREGEGRGLAAVIHIVTARPFCVWTRAQRPPSRRLQCVRESWRPRPADRGAKHGATRRQLARRGCRFFYRRTRITPSRTCVAARAEPPAEAPRPAAWAARARGQASWREWG